MTINIDSNSSIGVFDSGIGGLSVITEIKKLLPQENIICFSDSKFCIWIISDSFVLKPLYSISR